ncbi:ATP-binding cassette sub-family C member 12-like isoform X1 [Schistocerca gregaria]|uniref:ATP-binding cassette sub-family C member 12-like isoform X1 n=2 Tax=Schistocerca gregaria TaxID=7010 RepID=UPI00211EA4B7|nr:ATP-binding cassette sub-family C member 12-like isoform X1 [Schistocerca gregaria]
MSNQNISAAGYVKLPTVQTGISAQAVREADSHDSSSITLMAPTATLETTYTHKSAFKRYSASFRSLIPIRKKPRVAERLPVDKIGLISMISFQWVTPFLLKAQKALALQTVSAEDSSKKMGERFYDLNWNAVVNRGIENYSMVYVIWKFIQTRALVAMFLFLVGTSIHISGLVSFLITSTGKNNIPEKTTTKSPINGLMADESATLQSSSANIYAAFGYALAEFFSSIFISWSWSMNYRTAVRVQSAVTYFLYKKMMTASCINVISTQQISSFCGVDSEKLFNAVLYTPLVLSAPLVFIFCSCGMLSLLFTWKKVTFLILSGIISFCVMTAVSQARALSAAKAEQLSSSRVSELKDMLQNMKLAKMVQWETIVFNNFRATRKEELRYVKESYIWSTIGISLVHTIPIMSASTLLLFRSLFNVPSYMVLGALFLAFIPLKTSLHHFWTGISYIKSAEISLSRLKETQLLPTIIQNVNRGIDQQVAVSVNKISCEWLPVSDISHQKNENGNITANWCCGALRSRHEDLNMTRANSLILENISLIAEKGSIIGLCGEPGSGKTALLMAILGQLKIASGSGHITRNGFCAYVKQNPWMWDATLRDNIVFMEEFKRDRYYNAVYSCLLSSVLQNLAAEDETAIANETLSMGVQQRIELARAVYSNRDIYLIDEPLTMVDPNTRRTVFEKAILTALKGKTVFIATKLTTFLTQCDIIYVLKNGKIIASGQHEQLINSCNYYADLLTLYMDNTQNIQGLQSYDSVSTLSSDVFKTSSNLNSSLSSVTTACDDEVAALTGEGPESEEIVFKDNLSTYLLSGKQRSCHAFLACGLVIQLVCFLSIITALLLFILKFEANFFSTLNPDVFYGIIASIAILITAAFLGSAFSFLKVTGAVSTETSLSWMKKICDTYITCIQKETTTSILNWFSLHLHNIDTWVPESLISITGNIVLLLGILTLLAYVFTWILLPFFVACVFGFFGYRIYLMALPNFHKLETESSSNLNAFMTSTIEGRTSVQSYSKENDFIYSFVKQNDQKAASVYLIKATSGCISFWISMLKVLLITLVMLMIALMRNHEVLIISAHKLTATTVGFIFICINLLSTVIQNLTQDIAEYLQYFKYFEANSKLQNIEVVPTNNKSPYTWAEEGSIFFHNVKLKFWPPGHKALTFKIKNNQKIGIFGYPDAGRKSIGAALYRLVELSEGRIFIGGVNIEKIPLSVLRSKIAVVPHNPILFRGTIRSNLIDNNDSSICNIYEALEAVGMREKVEELPEQAETAVQTGTNLFTTGECQLLYLARAILSNPKILIVEEPLVPINKNIHRKLQEVIETAFQKTTVITIAQHLKFVEYCDKLLLIRDGQVVEYDTPARLLRNPRSALSAMITETEL